MIKKQLEKKLFLCYNTFLPRGGSIMDLKKNLKNDTSNQSNVLYSLPYYGKANTIANVTLSDDSHFCYVTRYGYNGDSNKIFPVPKKYLKRVEDNFISDLRNYLLSNDDKYRLAKISQKNISKLKVLGMSFSSFSMLFVTTLGIVFTDGVLGGISSLGFISSFVGSCYSTTQIKKYFDNKKSRKFINEYKNHEKELNNYNINRDEHQNNLTRYHGINKGYSNDLDLVKIRVKKKD